MSQIKTTEIEGDVAIGRHVTTGGNAIVRGRAIIDKSLMVKGWLEARNIKGYNKGLFVTLDKLREAYPEPHAGWCALVGTSLPAQLYVERDGKWVDTGSLTGEPTVEGQEYNEAVDMLEKALLEAERQLEALIQSMGMPDGIAPLGPSGKVESRYLPSYVDDVVEFGGENVLPDGSTVEFVEEPPQEPAPDEYPFVVQLNVDDKVCYIDSIKRFGIVYHLSGDRRILKSWVVTRWDGCERMGELTGTGIAPESDKIYINTSNNEQYRWGGTTLVKLGHNPLGLGTTPHSAFPGSEGEKLRKSVAELTNDLNGLKSFLQSVIGEYNLSLGWDEEAYESLEDVLVDNRRYFEDIGGILDNMRIRFRLQSGGSSRWVVYEFWRGPSETWDYLTPECWRLVESSDGGNGSGGSCDDAVCAANSAAIVKIQSRLTDIDTKLKIIENEISAPGEPADPPAAAEPLPLVVAEVKEGRLCLHGAKQWAAAGYVPYLLRHNKRRSTYDVSTPEGVEKRVHSKAKKGWHMNGHEGAVRIDDDGLVEFADWVPRNDDYHTLEQGDTYSTLPTVQILTWKFDAPRPGAPKGSPYITWGSRHIRLSRFGNLSMYETLTDSRIPWRSISLRYSIAFAKPLVNPSSRSAIQQGLSSNLAEFTVRIQGGPKVDDGGNLVWDVAIGK